jgi:predicted amidohydrolase
METTSDTVRVAAIQFNPVLTVKEENLERLLALTEEAAREGARLVVLPEMATTGYCWYDREEVAPMVEPIPGPTTERFARVARAYDCFVVVGMVEVEPATDIYYNSAALIGPEGVVGVYRKTHSYISEPKWAKDGDIGLPCWETPIGRIGIVICQDADFFEPARIVALRGADVICFPTNWLGEKSPGAPWLARAFENGCYLIAANRSDCERGVRFSGGSAVIDPHGSIQSRHDCGEGIVYGEVSLREARRKTFAGSSRPDKMVARRPELYQTMTLNTYLWNPLEFHGLYGHRPLPEGRVSAVAAVQFAPVLRDVAGNVARMGRLCTDRESARGRRSGEGRLWSEGGRRTETEDPDGAPSLRRVFRLEQTAVEGNSGRAQVAPTDGWGEEGLVADRDKKPASGGVELVVFPEYAVTGCPGNAAEAEAVALARDGEWVDALARMAAGCGVTVVAGLVERDGPELYSTAVCVQPDGARTWYRKTHPVGSEREWCRPGAEGPPRIDLPAGRVGVLLGSDLCFPEIVRSLAIDGCDVIAVPSGPGVPPVMGLGATAVPLEPPIVVESDPLHFHLARQRATENQCYLAFASLPEPAGIGHSGVFGPAFESRAEEQVLDGREDGVALGRVDTTNLKMEFPTNPVRAKSNIRMRQPYLYDLLQVPGVSELLPEVETAEVERVGT